MDTLFLIVAGVFLVAWLGGLLISIPSLWTKVIGNHDLKHRIKRSIPIKRKSRSLAD
jgi:hypothetical protein